MSLVQSGERRTSGWSHLAARSRECAFRCRVGGGHGRVQPPGQRPGFRLLRTLELGRKPAARLADGDLLRRHRQRRGRRRVAQERRPGRFVALQTAEGRASRRRRARPARAKRFRPDHRRHVGRWLLQRHRHDLDRRRQSEHPVERHRGLCARRGKLPQPRRRSRVHQRQSRDRYSVSARSACSGQTARSFRKPNFRRGSCRLKPGDPAAAAELRAAQARIVDYFRKQGRPFAKVAVDRPRRRSRSPCDGPDVDGRSGADRPVRRSDDERAARLQSSHRALLPLYPAGRPLFAAGDRRRPEHDSPDPGGRRRADHRGNDARRLWPPALHGRCRGPAALRHRRLGEIFDHQWARRPSLLGRPQRVWRRRTLAPSGRRLLCAALVS